MKQIVTRNNLIFGEGMPKICIPLMGKNKEELAREIDCLKNAAFDLVEWRVDFFEEVSQIPKVLETLSFLRERLENTPILFTFRTKQEGGQAAITAQEYCALNCRVIRTGHVDLVDAELFMGNNTVLKIIETAHQYGKIAVVSNHDFQMTPPKEELLHRLELMRTLGADLPKIAVMPASPKDVLALLEATETYTTRYQSPVITMSMGKLGAVSRICGETFGSVLTFGTAQEASAPGQLPSVLLKEILTQLHQ
ncbi:3-dehydroquinate dehydratase [uncultured Ruminococcus sp.]|uniref:type I 3-dehydroquinate dehydratase n=1 Tax=Massiliimalia timonensis TaxID=1987501 RepID=UPI0008219196|nr:type I 3-dehydroquinate dehydratase [Massiliimalia timonensis]SCH12160.1 3-dehydroquinate dehydratase [uncultured Ruminococcus sp.]SCH79832.1 3-dehydroquinate dehydratase [uncultured Clostridium sp.]